MNIFGVGTWEMAVIVIGALLIFGPGKLPEVLGHMGKAVRDFRRMTSDLSREFEQAVGSTNEIRASIEKEIAGVKSTVSSTASTATRDFKQGSTSGGKTTGSAAKSTTTGSRGKTSSSAKPTASTAATTAKPATATKLPAPAATAANGAKAVSAPAPASKADPLADVLLFDAGEMVEDAPAAKAVSARPAPTGARATTAPARTAPNGANGATLVGDPLARARQRRANAGYGVGRQAGS